MPGHPIPPPAPAEEPREPTDAAEIDKALETHGAQLRAMVDEIYGEMVRNELDQKPFDGEIDGIRYRAERPYRQGKQQVVGIIEFTLPDGQRLEMVCKDDPLAIHDAQRRFPVLQRHLPRIYFETGGVAAIERIDGLELDRYVEAMRDGAFLERMAREAATIAHDIDHSEHYLNDVDFTLGHNVMYDLRQRRLRVFDIHTLERSDAPPSEKLLKLLESMVNYIGAEPRGGDLELMKVKFPARDIELMHAKFLIRFFKEYVKAYPDEPLSYQGEKDVALDPGTAEYDAAIEWIERRRPNRTVYGQKISVSKKGTVGIDPEIRSLIEREDAEGLLNALRLRPIGSRVTRLIGDAT